MSEHIITTYTELIGAIDTQREGMGLRHIDFEKLAGFAPGLWGKVAGLLQVKQIRIEKTFDALRAAGLRIRVEVDPDQLAKMQARMEKKLMHPRQANQSRPCHSSTTPSSAVLTRVFKAMGRKGGKGRWAGKSKKERAAHGKLMVMAREKKRRAKKRAATARRQGAAHRAANEVAKRETSPATP